SRLGCAVICVAWLFACGCALNPITGQPQIVLLSAQQEAALGGRLAQDIVQATGVVSTPELSPYVNALGRELASIAPGPAHLYHVSILDTPEPNAFALPGGYVFVSRGLLAYCNDADEIAGALAH